MQRKIWVYRSRRQPFQFTLQTCAGRIGKEEGIKEITREGGKGGANRSFQKNPRPFSSEKIQELADKQIKGLGNEERMGAPATLATTIEVGKRQKAKVLHNRGSPAISS